jgi:hypothetical protein
MPQNAARRQRRRSLRVEYRPIAVMPDELRFLFDRTLAPQLVGERPAFVVSLTAVRAPAVGGIDQPDADWIDHHDATTTEYRNESKGRLPEVEDALPNEGLTCRAPDE